MSNFKILSMFPDSSTPIVGVALKWLQKFYFLLENLQKSVVPASALLLEDVDSLLRRPSHLEYQQLTPQHGRKKDKSGGTQHPTVNVHHYFTVEA
jgi:hypothetical protein